MFQRPDKVFSTLHIIVPIFNPQRYRSRWELYEKFVKHAESCGATVWTIEVATGDRAFAITNADNPRHIQLRTFHELWLKENMINLAVSRLPLDWELVAWVDGDVSFVRPDWIGETIHQLQKYPIVQMWSELQDVDDNYRVISTAHSFASSILAGEHPTNTIDDSYYGEGRGRPFPWHPGIAWAARREWWQQTGGLLDVCILGSADTYMARSLTGDVDKVMVPGLSQGYRRAVQRWQKRIHEGRWEERDLAHIGCVGGTVVHHWHGPKSARGYATRNAILINNKYDPYVDLKRDYQGLYQLTNRNRNLRHDLQQYFPSRNEDQLSV